MTAVAPRVKFGTMIAFTGGRQQVVTEDGETFWLTLGWDAAPDAKIGDRIKLEYRADARVGLWYGSVVAKDGP